MSRHHRNYRQGYRVVVVPLNPPKPVPFWKGFLVVLACEAVFFLIVILRFTSHAGHGGYPHVSGW